MNTNFSGGNAGSLFGGGVYFAEDIEKADQCVIESRDIASCLILFAGRYTGPPDNGMDEQGLTQLHSLLYPKGDHPTNVCYVLVCRVVLGYAIRTKGRERNMKTKKVTKQCVAMDGRQASATGGVCQTSNPKPCRGLDLTDGLCMRTHVQVFVETRGTVKDELVPIPNVGTDEQPVHYHSLVAETLDGSEEVCLSVVCSSRMRKSATQQGLIYGAIKRFREFISFHDTYIYPEFVIAYRRCAGHSVPRLQLQSEPESEPDNNA